jgi:hypothetical protein
MLFYIADMFKCILLAADMSRNNNNSNSGGYHYRPASHQGKFEQHFSNVYTYDFVYDFMYDLDAKGGSQFNLLSIFAETVAIGVCYVGGRNGSLNPFVHEIVHGIVPV